jgi:hypothetical protein
MMTIVIAGLAAASLAELGRMAVLRAGASRDAARAWLLAEATLTDVVAAVDAGTTLTPLLAHPPALGATPAGWSAAVAVTDDADDTPNDPHTDRNGRVRVLVTVLGPPPVRRRLQADVGRGAASWRAAVVLGGSVTDLTPAFAVDGRDYRMGAGCQTLAGTADRFGLSLPAAATLPAPRAGQIVGAAADPSVSRAAAPDLSALATTPGATHLAAGLAAGALGTTAAPRATVVDGDATVTASAAGAGLLYVRGRLRITGTLDFVGIVAASGGMIVDVSGRATVCGGVWAATDPALGVAGAGWVRLSSEAIDLAARVAPVPARARIIAMRELFQ